jgi:Flp pilus assembly protein TadD
MQGLAGDLPPEHAKQRTRAAVLRALELDGELAEAHTVLGGFYEAYDWNSDAAAQELLRALELDPNYPTAHHWYGNVLTSLGRFDEAIAAKRKAVELDPLAPVLIESLGSTLARAGRVAEAFDALRNALELDSTYWRAHHVLGSLYEQTGRLDEAVHAHRRAAVFAHPNVNARAGLARVLALAGPKEEAQRILDELQKEATATGIYAPAVAAVLISLNDVDGAFVWLERAHEQGHPELRHLGSPSYARVAHDPRYFDLQRRIRLRQ